MYSMDMATWHQSRAGIVAPHPGKWTVLIDPPHECRSTVVFDNEEDALRYAGNCAKHRPHQKPYIHILNPA